MADFSIKNIPPCIEASVADAFRVQLSMTASLRKMSMDSSEHGNRAVDCLSSLILNSSTLTGSLAIGFPRETFCKVLGRMIGEEVHELTADNSDASSEMLNIIFGAARRMINEGGFDFDPAIPTTVTGQGLVLSKANMAGTALYFDYDSEAGPFLLMLSLKAKAASAAKAG